MQAARPIVGVYLSQAGPGTSVIKPLPNSSSQRFRIRIYRI